MSFRDIFLPYTPFHLASAVRTLRAGFWLPSADVIMIDGLGTSQTASGKAYAEAFRREIRNYDISYREIGPGAAKLSYGFCKLLAANSPYRLLTGNPRRSPSMLLARRATEVIMIDEGLGTMPEGGDDFSLSRPEHTWPKRLLQSLSILPDFASVLAKISQHPTVFSTSIFPNPVRMKFEPILSIDNRKDRHLPHNIFVSSYVRNSQISRYVAWARNRFDLTREFSLSVHPQMTTPQSLRLSREMDMPLFDQGPILLEEYVKTLVDLGRSVKLIGQINSTTKLLENIGINNVDIDVDEFPA
jgi:hypothetical protein